MPYILNVPLTPVSTFYVGCLLVASAPVTPALLGLVKAAPVFEDW